MHKVMKCWYTIREMTGYSVTVGTTKGAQALYPMLLTKPMKIVSFDFLTQDKGLRVAIQADLDEENQGQAQPVTLADAQEIPAALPRVPLLGFNYTSQLCLGTALLLWIG